MNESYLTTYNQAYIDRGEGPTVLLLHGLFGNLSIWKPCVETLSQEFRVIVPRLPLFDLPVNQTNIRYLVKALHQFISSRDLRDVVLIGHALGGQVALLYTFSYPSSVKKIVLTGSTGLPQTSYLTKDLIPENFDYAAVKEKVQTAFYHQNEMPENLVKEIFQTVQNIPKRLTINTFDRSAKQVAITPILNRIDHPVLLIWGTEDLITPPESALHFQDFIYDVELRFVKDCGHLPMIEQPDIFIQHLLDFLKGDHRKKNFKGNMLFG